MPRKPPPKRVVVEHTSAMMRSMLTVSDSLAGVEHNVSKGTLREQLLGGLIRRFLPKQLSATSGFIIDHDGRQSSQTDIVIYDTRLLPPFISEDNVAAIPAEAAVATIEVKSRLAAADIRAAERAARRLRRIYERLDLGVPKPLKPVLAPLTYVFGFLGKGPKILRDPDKGATWLGCNLREIKGVVLAGQFSWMMVRKKWVPGFATGPRDTKHEETKRFFAILVDNTRFIAEIRYQYFTRQYRDWLGPYIRG